MILRTFRPLLLAACATMLVLSASGQIVRLGSPEGYVVARTTDRPVKAHVRPDRHYHWVRAQEVQITEGGAGGALLHGPYLAYHPNGQLREQGTFDRGLKDGEWRSWNTTGDLLHLQHWKEGRLHGLTKRYVAGTVAKERYRNGERLKEKPRKPKAPRKSGRKDADEVPAVDVPAGEGAVAVPEENGRSKSRKERTPRSEKSAKGIDDDGEKTKKKGKEGKAKDAPPVRERRRSKKDERP